MIISSILHKPFYVETVFSKNGVVWGVRTDVSKEHRASIIRVTRIGALGTLAITSNYYG
jgi:hypothetical protein